MREHPDETMYKGKIPIVINVLQALPDTNDELHVDACIILEEEITFMALDVLLRRKRLVRKLRPSIEASVSLPQRTTKKNSKFLSTTG